MTGPVLSLAATTLGDMIEVDQLYMLISVQRIETPIEQFHSIVCFLDGRSNISIFREAWVEAAGHQGLPITRTVYVAGGSGQEWATNLYNVPLLKNNSTVVTVMAMRMVTMTKRLEVIDH